MPVEAYQWESVEKATPVIEKPSAIVYEPKEGLKWYDKIFKPPYVYLLLGSIAFWMIWQLYLKRMR